MESKRVFLVAQADINTKGSCEQDSTRLWLYPINDEILGLAPPFFIWLRKKNPTISYLNIRCFAALICLQ